MEELAVFLIHLNIDHVGNIRPTIELKKMNRSPKLVMVMDLSVTSL